MNVVNEPANRANEIARRRTSSAIFRVIARFGSVDNGPGSVTIIKTQRPK